MKKKQLHIDNLYQQNGRRPRIAFFDYPDVFEDFYPHYGVTQEAFAKTWRNTANHARMKIVQEEIGDVTWYALSLKPESRESVTHEYVGCKIKFLPSSWLHRQLWKLFYSKIKSWKFRNRWYHAYATFASYFAIFSWPLLKTLRKDKPDVIFSQDYCSGRFDSLHLLSWWLRIPLVAVHSGSTGKYMGAIVKRVTIPKTDWIFTSGKREEIFLKKKYKLNPNRMSIVRSPIDISVYKPDCRESACLGSGLDSNKRYFLFIGRLDDSVKRVNSIITAFQKVAAKFADIDLLILGTGKDEEKLKEQAEKQVPGRVHFNGWVAREDEKVRLLNIAECLVLASKREGFPTVVGEALACGLPVVSSDVGAISDLVIEDKTGWLFAPQDDEGLLNRLIFVAENSQKIKSMRSFIRDFAVDHISVEALTDSLKLGFSSLKLRSQL
jgi:glycosyltransferase involved in cell wall biosynthesis